MRALIRDSAGPWAGLVSLFVRAVKSLSEPAPAASGKLPQEHPGEAACVSGIMWPAPSMTLRRACRTLLSTASQIARSTTDVADPSMTCTGTATDASEPAVTGASKSTS